MHYRISLALCLLSTIFLTGTSSAATRDEIKSAIEARYRITTVGFLGNFQEIGSVLTVRREGLGANRPSKSFKPNIIENREITAIGGGNLPLGGNLDGKLGVGDRLHLYAVRIGDDFVELDLFTVKTFVLSGSGTRGPTPLQASTRFRYQGGLHGVTVKQVLDDMESWLRADAQTRQDLWSGPIQEAKPQGNPGKTLIIQLGQTTEEVVAILGEPGKKVLLGAKSVFVYRDVKVVFVEGKVADAY